MDDGVPYEHKTESHMNGIRSPVGMYVSHLAQRTQVQSQMFARARYLVQIIHFHRTQTPVGYRYTR